MRIGAVDKTLMHEQWQNLRDVYRDLVKDGFLEECQILAGEAEREDMVFSANQTFPWLLDGEKVFIPSKMRHLSRKLEVPFYAKFFLDHGYKELILQSDHFFEGMGDLIAVPMGNKLFSGYGFRTQAQVLVEVSQLLNIEIIPLELVDERFYHLDTCFLPLDPQTALLLPQAFSRVALDTLEETFPTLISVPIEEALNFSLNAHVMIRGGRRVAIIQKGNPITSRFLEQAGFKTFHVETSEFMKAGGSVFCMKMMFW